MRYVRSFGAFWYDFLVGDRPELFVAPILVLGVIWVAGQAGVSGAVSAIGLTILVILVGAGSLFLATRPKT